MQRDDTPHTTASELSTQDLAQPRTSDAAPDTAPPPPVYPGEGDSDETERTVSDSEADDFASRGAEPADTDKETRARTGDADEMPQLLRSRDEDGFRTRWEKIQTTFVDDPRQAVQAADTLVANVMQTLATTFDEHKKNLEEQWNRGEQADTEALRTALRHYRSFFNRLLTT
ncbi:hypothetical protein AB0D11_43030 [Streptomyces monashensis]|uniref:hypothetical protein n=1 Tax=Streptomyces monashensis TaxID=1678012 RepID=UPI003400F16F